MCYVYVEENKPFGRDSKGSPITVRAFEKLKVIRYSPIYAVVKKVGRGQRREFLIRKDELFIA